MPYLRTTVSLDTVAALHTSDQAHSLLSKSKTQPLNHLRMFFSCNSQPYRASMHKQQAPTINTIRVHSLPQTNSRQSRQWKAKTFQFRSKRWHTCISSLHAAWMAALYRNPSCRRTSCCIYRSSIWRKRSRNKAMGSMGQSLRKINRSSIWLTRRQVSTLILCGMYLRTFVAIVA